MQAVVWLIASSLLAADGPAAPTQPVEVPVWKITGYLRAPAPGLRVDALFLAAGRDGAPADPRQVLLTLRSVEFLWTPQAGRAWLRLHREQAEAIKSLPPSLVELQVAAVHGGSRAAPIANASPPPRSGKRRYAELAYEDRVAAAAGYAEGTWHAYDGRPVSWPAFWRGMMWFALVYLVAACCMQMWLSPRRRLVHRKRGSSSGPGYRAGR